MKTTDVSTGTVQEVHQPVVPASPYVTGNVSTAYTAELAPEVKRFRESFAIFGMSALLFGICFTACFFRAKAGISYPVFVLAAIALIQFVGVKLRGIRAEVADRCAVRIAIPYYIAAVLISVTVVLTAKPVMHFFSTVAVILLLEVAFLELLFSDAGKRRNFEERCKEVLLLPFVAIANCMTGLTDGFGFLRKMKFFRNEKVRHILLGVLIAVPLLVLVFVLLSSADMIFSSWTVTALDHIFFSANPYLACLLTVVIYAAAYGIMAAASRMMTAGPDGERKKREKKENNALTAITVTVLLTLVYLLFCGIQLYFLFGGGKVSLPEGFTYAEYARQGFFQLLAVTFLNILVLMVCRKPAAQSVVLRVVMTVFSACTYIMIASAAMRMLLYVDAYSLSFLRILVLWFLALNTLLVTGIILAVYRAAFPLFRYFVAVSAICYIVLAYADVDYLIASYNLRSESAVKTADMDYLASLSEDAAPVLVPVLQEILEAEKKGLVGLDEVSMVQRVYATASDKEKYVMRRSLADYVVKITEREKEDFRSWNHARHKAQALLAEYDLINENRITVYFTNYSDHTVFSVEYTTESETIGMQNADYSPLEYGETVIVVDDIRTVYNENGKLGIYDKRYERICSVQLDAEELRQGAVSVELYTDPYGVPYCMVSACETPED